MHWDGKSQNSTLLYNSHPGITVPGHVTIVLYILLCIAVDAGCWSARSTIQTLNPWRLSHLVKEYRNLRPCRCCPEQPLRRPHTFFTHRATSVNSPSVDLGLHLFPVPGLSGNSRAIYMASLLATPRSRVLTCHRSLATCLALLHPSILLGRTSAVTTDHLITPHFELRP